MADHHHALFVRRLHVDAVGVQVRLFVLASAGHADAIGGVGLASQVQAVLVVLGKHVGHGPLLL